MASTSTKTRSGLVWQLFRGGVGFIMAENGQFNGNGVSFTNFTLTQSATLSTGVGTFSGKQTPRNAKGKT